MEFNFKKVSVFQKQGLSRGGNAYFVSISKMGNAQFSKPFVEDMGISETSKYAEFFFDEIKKTIGFRFIKTLTLGEDKKLKQFRTYKIGKVIVCRIAIRSIFNLMGIRLDKSFTKLPIEKYKDPLYGEMFYFTLKHDKVKSNQTDDNPGGSGQSTP